MADDDKDDDKDLPQVGGNPADSIANELLKQQRKEKNAELKKAMGELQSAAKVFIGAYDKCVGIQEEINDMTKIDFTGLRKTLNL